MSGHEHNPNDPAYLASREIDGDLSADERQRLQEALVGSEALRAEVDGLRAVDAVVRQWGASSIEVDWDTSAQLIQAMVTGKLEGASLSKVDDILARWANSAVDFDETMFASAVISRIAPVARKYRLPRMVFRVGAPLAAAAAIVLAVTVGPWTGLAPSPRSVVRIGPAEVFQVAARAPSADIRAQVSFVQSDHADLTVDAESDGIGLLSLGVGGNGRGRDDSSPL